MAGNFDADVTLQTLLKDVTLGILHGNVAGISIIPDIILVGEAKTKANMVAGIFEIEKAQRGRSEEGRTHRDELYLIPLTFRYQDANSPPTATIAFAIMDEFERVLDKNTLTAANGYLYAVLDSKPTGSNANLKFTIILEATQWGVRADGT